MLDKFADFSTFLWFRLILLFVTHWPRNPNWRGRHSTVDLLNEVVCFVKDVKMSKFSKATYLNWLVLGGQSYWSFPFSKGSLHWQSSAVNIFSIFSATILLRTWNNFVLLFISCFPQIIKSTKCTGIPFVPKQKLKAKMVKTNINPLTKENK